MKKVIPVIIAIILIFMIVAFVLGDIYMEKYSYSKEQEDVISYFGIEEENSMAILLQDTLVEEKAMFLNGACYFTLDTIHTYLNERFYVDNKEGFLIYTTPTERIMSGLGSKEYIVETYDGLKTSFSLEQDITVVSGEVVYVLADFVQLYTNYSFDIFENPNRVIVRNYWGEATVATVSDDTNVRTLGGIKSPILTPVDKGDQVTILEQMETWSKVKTEDGYIGYVENKKLGTATTLEETNPVIYQTPEYTSLTKDYKISMGWFVSSEQTLEQLLATTKGMNTIAPVWFSVKDNEGNISDTSSVSFVNTAQARGVEVWGTFDDFNYALNNGTTVDMHEVLSATSTRDALVNNIMTATLNCGMDGINIDFEKISADAGIHFVQFIRELSIQCRARGIVLSIDNYSPMGFNDYYDIEEQGIVADYVVIMGYDEHWGGGGVAGSVASIDYVLKGIENTIAKVEAKKVINALPFYTRVWKTEGATVTDVALTMKNVASYINNNNIEYAWDDVTCQNYAEWVENGVTYQVWFEDALSINAKLNVMQSHDIGGVAVWRLGYEQSDIWELISVYSSQ